MAFRDEYNDGPLEAEDGLLPTQVMDRFSEHFVHKKIGGAIKGIGKQIGKAVSLPVRGVGRIARGNFREGFGDLLGGAGRLALIGTGAGALGFGPGASLLGGLGRGALGAIKGVGGAIGSAGRAAGGGGGGGEGRGFGGFLKDNLPTILGGVGAFMNSRDATRRRGFEDEERDFARESMERRRQQEDKIFSQFGQPPQQFDFGSTFADPSNPFAQRAIQSGGGINMPANVLIPGVGG